MNKKVNAAIIGLLILSGALVGCGNAQSDDASKISQKNKNQISIEQIYEEPSLLGNFTDEAIDFGSYVKNISADINVFTINEEIRNDIANIKLFKNESDNSSLLVESVDGSVSNVLVEEYTGIIDEGKYNNTFIEYKFSVENRYNEFDYSKIANMDSETIASKYKGNDIERFWNDFKVVIPNSKIVNTANNMVAESYNLGEGNKVVLLMDGQVIKNVFLNEEINPITLIK